MSVGSLWSVILNECNISSWLKLRYPPQGTSQCNRQTFGWWSTQPYCFSLTPKCSSLCCVLCDGLAQIKTGSAKFRIWQKHRGCVCLLIFRWLRFIKWQSFPASVFIQTLFDGGGFSWKSSSRVSSLFSVRPCWVSTSKDDHKNVFCCLWCPSSVIEISF